MKKKIKKRWISKSALTLGVYPIYTKPSYSDSYVAECREDGSQLCVNGFFDKDGKYDFATREEALEHAEVLRAKRIASLEKQIAKLKSLEIKVKEEL